MNWFRRKRKDVVIPRVPEMRPKPFIEFSEPEGMSERDWRLLSNNRLRVELAFRLGLDLAISRGDGKSEYLVAGDDPSAQNGFVVVRNQDA